MRLTVAFLVLALLGVTTVGCRNTDPGSSFAPFGLQGPQPGPPLAPEQSLPNPLQVPAADAEFFWNQLVDTVDDYFSIRSERMAQFADGLPIEGLIETQYQPGATLLEPWRWDSTSDFEQLQSTFQSIRRRAVVRVVPVGGNMFAVNVEVFKELEDADRPSQALPGSSIPRHDGSLIRFDRDEDTRLLPNTVTLGWIPIGRDMALEQEILRQLYGRLIDSGP